MNLNIDQILKKYWGYDSFRPLQREIIESVLEGHDTLGLMPTGGGKSLTFQVPGLALPGITIVVTPLIALMKDQTDNLKSRHIQAVYFHSGQTMHERRRAWERIINNRAQFIYIAPERLKSKTFISEIRNLKVSLIVVDEAHCISQWGYDFRPSYLNIKTLRKMFPKTPVLALTATAPPMVRNDIRKELSFGNDANEFSMSFRRNNISYIVRESQAKLSEILNILSKTSGSSIIYVRSRKRAREISEYLNNAGISATFYHAGLDPGEKDLRQTTWIAGKIRVMVATNAFGMGIDKPDVRVVIHFQMPPSLEEYYQEAGRAGRDGLPSFAVLLTTPADKAVLRRNVTLQFPERDVIRRIYTRICVFLHKAIGEGYNSMNDFDFDKFIVTFRLEPRTAMAAINLLEKAGYIEYIAEAENLSRLMITVNREELYDIKVRTPQNEKVLVALLRKYPGLFTDYVFINEGTIANETSLDRETVYNCLLELSKMKVVSYIPRRKSPMVVFTTAMEEEKYIMIGKAIYEDRKAVLSQRVESMIDYGFSHSSCRVARMLNYLGEKNSEDCNHCDFCRSQKVKNSKTESYQELGLRLMNLLKQNPGGISPCMIEKEMGTSAEKAFEIIEHLCNEGLAIPKDGLYMLKQS